jgi:hypothetical protein
VASRRSRSAAARISRVVSSSAGGEGFDVLTLGFGELVVGMRHLEQQRAGRDLDRPVGIGGTRRIGR